MEPAGASDPPEAPLVALLGPPTPGSCQILLIQPCCVTSQQGQPSQGSAAQAQVLSLYVGWQGQQETLEVLGVAHRELTGSMVVLGPTLLNKPDGMVMLDHGTPFLSVRQHRVSCPPSLTSLKPITSVVLLLADAGKPGTARSAQHLCTALDALMAGEASTEQLLQQAQVIKDEAASWLHHLVNVMVVSSEVGQEFQGLWDAGASALAVQISNSETEQVQPTALKVQMQLWQQHFSPFLSDLAAVITCVRMLTQYQPRELLGLQSGAVVGTQRGRVFSIGLRTLELARMLVDYLLQQPVSPIHLLQEVQQCVGTIAQVINEVDQQAQAEAEMAASSRSTQVISRVFSLLDRSLGDPLAGGQEAGTSTGGTTSEPASTAMTAQSSAQPGSTPIEHRATALPSQEQAPGSASAAPGYSLVLPQPETAPVDFNSGDMVGVRTYYEQEMRGAEVAAATLASRELPRDQQQRTAPLPVSEIQPAEPQEEEVFLTPQHSDVGEWEQEEGTSSTARLPVVLKHVVTGFEDDELERAFLRSQARAACRLDLLCLLLHVTVAACIMLLMSQTTPQFLPARLAPTLVLCKAIAFISSLMPVDLMSRQIPDSRPRSMTARSYILAAAMVLETVGWFLHLRSAEAIPKARTHCNIHLLLDAITQPVIIRAPVRHMWLPCSLSVIAVAPQYCTTTEELPTCAVWPALAVILMTVVFVAADAIARHRFVRVIGKGSAKLHQE